MKSLLERITSFGETRPRLTLIAFIVIALVCAGLALGLAPSSNINTLVSSSSRDYRNTDTDYHQFGGQAVDVLVRGNLTDLVAGSNIVKLSELEACFGGHSLVANNDDGVLEQAPAAKAKPYGGSTSPCGHLMATRPTSVVYGPATFLNQAVLAVNTAIFSILGNEKSSAEGEVAKVMAAAKARGDSTAQIKKIGEQAAAALQQNDDSQLLSIVERDGLTSLVSGGLPSIQNSAFIDSIIFDTSSGQSVPKARFAYLFPTSDSALIQVRLRPDLDTAQATAAIHWITAATRMASFRLGNGGSYLVTGEPVALNSVSATLSGQVALLLVGAVIVMAVVLLLVFRRRRRLLPLALALAAAAITFGVFAIAGGTLTMASIAVLPILIGLAVDYGIQFQSRASGATTIAAAAAATATGFVVLQLSPVPMVRGFGLLLVYGVLIALIVVLGAGSAALVITRADLSLPRPLADAWDGLRGRLTPVGDRLAPLIDRLTDGALVVVDALADARDAVWERLRDAGERIWDGVAGAGERARDGLAELGERAADGGAALGRALVDSLAGALELLSFGRLSLPASDARGARAAGAGRSAGRSGPRSLAGTLARLSARPRAVLVIGLILALGGWVADTQTSVQSNILKLVPSNLTALKNLSTLERVTGQSGELDVVVHADNVATPAVLQWMERYENAITRHFGYSESTGCDAAATVCPALSLTDLFSGSATGSNAAKPASLSQGQINTLLNSVPAYFSSAVINSDRTYAALSFGIRLMPLAKQIRVVAYLRRHLNPPPGVSAELAGLPVLAADADAALSSSSRRLLTLAAGIVAVALMLLAIFRRPRRALIPLVPIVLATGWSALIVWAIGIPLNPMSATLGALVIAISTEFSVLLAERFRRQRADGESVAAALESAYGTTGRAVVASGITAIAGFAVLIVSEVTMLRDFGLVTLIDMTVSLLGVLAVLPAALTLSEGGAPVSERLEDWLWWLEDHLWLSWPHLPRPRRPALPGLRRPRPESQPQVPA